MQRLMTREKPLCPVSVPVLVLVSVTAQCHSLYWYSMGYVVCLLAISIPGRCAWWVLVSGGIANINIANTFGIRSDRRAPVVVRTTIPTAVGAAPVATKIVALTTIVIISITIS